MCGTHLMLSRLCGIGATLIALSACGGDGGTGPGAVTPSPGTFSGSTSQSRSLSFIVTSQGITSATLNYQLSGSGCSYTATVTVGSSSPVPITNGQFDTGPFPVGANATMTATGRFTSATQANGNISIVDGGCGGSVNLTWNASK
jgi:hypothetical protein